MTPPRAEEDGAVPDPGGGVPAGSVDDLPGGEDRPPATSKHGKELLASHRLPVHTPPPRTWKPMLAGILMVIVAVGGFIFSGLYIAIPESPWISGQQGEIFGHVKGENDTPLGGAVVSVGDRQGQTNETGYFSLENVATGRQVIVIEAPGYKQLRWRTLITGGNPLGYSFLLAMGNGTETHDDVGELNGGFYSCGTLMLIFTSIILLGALFCFQRKRYPVATTGAILSFSVGYFQVFFLFGLIIPIGIIFSLASVVLLLFSRGEFS